MIDCIKQVYEVEGISGFYRGFGLAFAGAFAFRGAFAIFKVLLKPLLKGKKNGANWDQRVARFLATAVQYPFFTVQRMLMVQAGITTVGYYAGPLDCFRKVTGSFGYSGLYGGFIAFMIQTITIDLGRYSCEGLF